MLSALYDCIFSFNTVICILCGLKNTLYEILISVFCTDSQVKCLSASLNKSTREKGVFLFSIVSFLPRSESWMRKMSYTVYFHPDVEPIFSIFLKVRKRHVPFNCALQNRLKTSQVNSISFKFLTKALHNLFAEYGRHCPRRLSRQCLAPQHDDTSDV